MTTLSVQRLHFRYARTAPFIIDGLDVEVGPGESCLIVGDNGSGKSTLGRLLGGLLVPEAGEILMNQRFPHSLPFHERAKHTVYVGQVTHLAFFASSVVEEIALAIRQSGFTGDPEADYRVMALPADRSEKPLNLPLVDAWRLHLFIMAFLFNPEVLFIDEVIAPNARVQSDAVGHVLSRRRASGQVTLLAYQRRIQLGMDRTYFLEGGRFRED